MKFIKGKDIYNAFSNGAVCIEEQEEKLNSINFFPVADGDTGTNMVNTINTIVDHVTDKSSVKSVVFGMSEGALVGARGNSGFIFAQFINGFYNQTKNKIQITEKEFIDSLENAFPYVLDAINNPIKGTIITIIYEWTNFLKKQYSLKNSFKETLILSLSYSKEVLKNTKFELKTLRGKKVVDAGAKGFYHFIEGIVDYFTNGNIMVRKKISRLKFDSQDIVKNNDIIKYKYCTEFFFVGEKIKIKEIKEFLDTIGDSGIITSSDNKAKVHVHTNRPDILAKMLYDKGYSIIESKVDNMELQVNAKKNVNKIALVTDSIADISVEILDKYNIYVIPMIIRINESEFLDRVTISSKNFFNEVNKTEKLPKSSIPNLKLVKKLFEQLLESYEKIIYISVSSNLSGTYNSINKLANKISEKIYVIDSKKNAGAQGIIVLEAAKLIKSNEKIDFILIEINEIIENTEIYVAVKNLRYMVLGGRVPKTIGLLGNILNLKPIVSLDQKGNGIAFGKKLSRRGSIGKIYNILKKASLDGNVENVVISYSKNKEDALKLKIRIEKNLKIPVNYIKEVSSAVAISTGEGAIAISFNRR